MHKLAKIKKSGEGLYQVWHNTGLLIVLKKTGSNVSRQIYWDSNPYKIALLRYLSVTKDIWLNYKFQGTSKKFNLVYSVV